MQPAGISPSLLTLGQWACSTPDPTTSHLPTFQYAPCITTPGTSTTPSPIQQQCPNTTPPVHPGPEPKPLLKLPSSQQEWAEAKVKQLKNEARKDFRRANEQGLPIESIQVFARTFFKLVCEHSHLKRASQSAKQCSQASKPGTTATTTFGSLQSSYWTTTPPPKSLPSFLEMKPSASSRRYTMLMPRIFPSQSGCHHHYHHRRNSAVKKQLQVKSRQQSRGQSLHRHHHHWIESHT